MLPRKTSKTEIREERQEKRNQILSRQKIRRGCTLFEYNDQTHELKTASFDRTLIQVGKNGVTDSKYIKRVRLQVNCHYVQALNTQNAIKKLKKMGFKTFIEK